MMIKYNVLGALRRMMMCSCRRGKSTGNQTWKNMGIRKTCLYFFCHRTRDMHYIHTASNRVVFALCARHLGELSMYARGKMERNSHNFFFVEAMTRWA